MTSTPQLTAVLRQHGQSVTAARRGVFAALQGQEPLSMHELIARLPAIDRASVYRTVNLFEQLGIVERLQTGWKYKLELSDRFHEHHHHATCLRCGAVLPLAEDMALEKQLQTVAARHGFILQNHQIELSGLCAVCQAGKAAT